MTHMLFPAAYLSTCTKIEAERTFRFLISSQLSAMLAMCLRTTKAVSSRTSIWPRSLSRMPSTALRLRAAMAVFSGIAAHSVYASLSVIPYFNWGFIWL